MEAENLRVNQTSRALRRVLPAVAPVLLVSIGYVDPGKWAAIVEGGARFGFDLLLLFNFAAVLCQYLSARISLVTGRDLAQICNDEYDKCTCIFLGIQAEVSAILLDLTMILGIANGFHLLFGWDLSTCVLLTAVDAALFPVFAKLLEKSSREFLFICLAGLILLSFVLGVLISQPEISLSMNGMLTKLSTESAFALMGLLGASIMPHNFYLHSSIVQQYQGFPNISKDALCHDHFFAILCVFSGIYLVNYVIMNSAASMLYSTYPISLTFQDALMEQVIRTPVAPVAFLLLLFFSNQITALGWGLGGQVVLQDFLKLDIPGWLHCATIRIIAIIPALYCVWSSGAEGLYQLLIFAQVMVALMLPSSVIPLFRVAASKPIMGAYKVSQFVEFLALITCIGMLGLKMIFVVEMIFGNSDWANNLRWNMGSGLPIPYIILLVTTFGSFSLMLWLLATPLKSASAQLTAQVWKSDMPESVQDLSTRREEIRLSETRYHGEMLDQKQESSQAVEKILDSHSDVSVEDFDIVLPETIMVSDEELRLTSIEGNSSSSTLMSLPIHEAEKSSSTVGSVSAFAAAGKVPNADSQDPVEKIVGVEGGLRAEKEDDDGNNSEPEESTEGASVDTENSISEGPGSYRSLGGKSEESGNGPASLSRLDGLGRAARRQLAAILDEFWGQLYDFHGQVTREAKNKKLDVLLGVDSKPANSLQKLDATGKVFPGNISSVGWKEPHPLTISSLYDSLKKQRQNSLDSPYGGVQKGSPSLWSNHMQMLDTYVQNSSYNVLDSGERRYSSVRHLPSSESWDQQPATVHGYHSASYLSRIGKDWSLDNLSSQVESSALKFQSLGGGNLRDSHAFALGQKLQNGGLGTGRISSFDPAVSRNSLLQSERPYFDACPSGTAETLINAANTKKYYSSPDIHRDLYVSGKTSQWDSPIDYGSTISRTSCEPSSLRPNSQSRAGVPLAFHELSPPKVYSALTSHMSSNSQAGSIWSRQPFENFGVAAERSHPPGTEEVGSRLNYIGLESASVVDPERWLLQSFRHCVVKLLKLEGSDWLFGQNDGADEELIDCVAARERFIYEVETRGMNQVGHIKAGEANLTNSSISSVPHCGEGCVWKLDLIISFGVWCIHRVLDLSLMESRPELWGKYTYVLNRLQGIIELAFSKPCSPRPPCFCLEVPPGYQQKSSPPISNETTLPPASKPGRGKCTTAPVLLDMIKNVEIAISCRKGRSGTAAGDVAFPKGKENLASVLKRYKRRLSKKVGGALDGLASSQKGPTPAPYN